MAAVTFFSYVSPSHPTSLSPSRTSTAPQLRKKINKSISSIQCKFEVLCNTESGRGLGCSSSYTLIYLPYIVFYDKQLSSLGLSFDFVGP